MEFLNIEYNGKNMVGVQIKIGEKLYSSPVLKEGKRAYFYNDISCSEKIYLTVDELKNCKQYGNIN